MICLEFDERFKIFGDDFVFYDYKEPLKLEPELKKKFDVVIADPPFLSDECLTKMAISMRFLSKEKLILCTGEESCRARKTSFLDTEAFVLVCLVTPQKGLG